MIELKGTLRRELIAFLSGLPILQDQNGYRYVLRNAGLGQLIPQINLAGPPQLVIGNIVDFLAQWGTVEGQESLLLFLFALMYEVGGESQEALQDFLEHLRRQRKSLPNLSNERDITPPKMVLEKLIGEPTLLPISFLERALELAQTVAYIETQVGLGTGFLIRPELLITNNHVLQDRAVAGAAIFRFNYQHNSRGALGPVKDYHMKLDGIFHTDQELDYTIVELKDHPGEKRSYVALSRAGAVRRDDRINIIQHPGGRPKEISFRNNFVEYVDEMVIQYVTHTEPGSSGSPVFNDRWEIVAIHHAGGNVHEPATRRHYYRNEGIMVKAIMESLPPSLKDHLGDGQA